MDMDFANPTPARPAPVRLESGSGTLARAFAPRFLQTQPRGWPRPCVLLPFTSIRLVGDFHPQAVKHAQHRWDRRPACRRCASVFARATFYRRSPVQRPDPRVVPDRRPALPGISDNVIKLLGELLIIAHDPV